MELRRWRRIPGDGGGTPSKIVINGEWSVNGMAKETNGKMLNPWRKFVKSAMRNAARQEALRKHKTANPSFNYRWEHVKAVVKTAMRLAELTGADVDIVEAAAWLHDIAKMEGGKHPRIGARIARQLLPQTDFPPEKIERVARAIEEHQGLWRRQPLTNLESMVLWDADKLTKIGLTSVFHVTGMFMMSGRKSNIKSLIKRGRAANWIEKTVASMHTEPARQAAAARVAAAQQMWDELERELHGEDLPCKEEASVGEQG